MNYRNKLSDEETKNLYLITHVIYKERILLDYKLLVNYVSVRNDSEWMILCKEIIEVYIYISVRGVGFFR